jgi:hypothetical protein
MAELLRNKVVVGVVVAVASAILGGLITGWVSLPKSVTSLEAKAAAAEKRGDAMEGRLHQVERDAFTRGEAGTAFTSLKNEIQSGFRDLKADIKADLNEVRDRLDGHIERDK